MAMNVAIGVQDFGTLIKNNCFYIDKTNFIRKWWESMDSVTLITRPKRFGKTLTMNMVERFFSIKYAGEGEIFSGLDIWIEEKQYAAGLIAEGIPAGRIKKYGFAFERKKVLIG